MANKIIIKNGAGAPGNGVLSTAELGFDTQNKLLYIGDSENTSMVLNPPEVTVDLEGANEGSANGINADTLGGLVASEYATKEYLIAEYATLEDINELQNNAVTEEQVADMISDMQYSRILNLTTANNVITADMLGKTIMCRVTGEDFSLTISKEVHDALPIGFEFALVYWNAANSVKVYFTGGINACMAGEGAIENATLALPGRYSMVALKKCTSQSWLVTGNVEVV